MSKTLVKVILSLLILIIVCQTASAQTFGKIYGVVTSADTGEPLAGANVTVRGTNLGAATDLDGRFIILRIPPGRYEVEASYIGFHSLVIQSVEVYTDLTTDLRFPLEPSPIEAGEAVVITAERPMIQRDRTSVEARISTEEIETLPATTLNEVLTLQAGVTEDESGALHIRGGRTSEISYLVNGISITDDFDKGQALEVMNESIAELQVISGTFNAEYGNAMSGVVNIVTRTGSNDFEFHLEAEMGDYLSGDNDLFPHIDSISPFDNTNLTLQVSGPVVRDHLTFFVSGRRSISDGWIYGENRYVPQGRTAVVDGDTLEVTGDGSAVPMNNSQTTSGQAVLRWHVLPNLILKTDFLASESNWREYSHEYRYNPNGFGENESYGRTGILNMTYLMSQRSYFELSLAHRLNGRTYSLYDNPYDSRYVHPDSLLYANYTFYQSGTELNCFERSTRSTILKADYTSQVTYHHQIKTGIDFQSDIVRYDDFEITPAEDENGQEIIPFEPDVRPINEINHNRYRRTPRRYAAYIQDKIEYESVIINVGLRYDLFDPQGLIPVDPEDPNVYRPLKLNHKYHDLNGDGVIELSEQVSSNEFTLEERRSFWYRETSTKSLVSPRFGIAYPITDRGVIHFSYGMFQQIPEYNLLYTDDERKVSEGANIYGPFGNPDLKPQRTTMYELGLSQQLTDRLAVSVTGFYRDIRDWISSGAVIPTSVASVSYVTYVNRDFANVRGLTVTLDGRLNNRFTLSGDYTYQIVEGTNSSPEDEYWAQINGEEPTKVLSPMNWDQRHALNLYAHYGTREYGITLLSRINSGQPYTPEILTGEYSGRSIISGLSENSRRKPVRWTVDLLAFHQVYSGAVDVRLSLQVNNLFDRRNPVTVFEDTGEADFTLNELLVANADEGYFVRPDYYSEPRSILIGVSCDF